MDFQTPRHLTEMLQEFTDVALREKPDDMVDFAAEYFTKIQADRNSYSKAKPKGVGLQAENAASTGSSSENSEDEPVPGNSIHWANEKPGPFAARSKTRISRILFLQLFFCLL